MSPDVVRQLLATDVALDKLGARRISADEVEAAAEERAHPGSEPAYGTSQATAYCSSDRPTTEAMSADPWTDPDPQPGDFDADLARLDPRYVEHREGGTDAKLVVLVEVKGEDAKRLERLSKARWKKAAEVVAELLRGADSSLA